jgi:hypothetical protein
MAFIIMVRGCCLSGGAVENHTKTRLVTDFFPSATANRCSVLRIALAVYLIPGSAYVEPACPNKTRVVKCWVIGSRHLEVL